MQEEEKDGRKNVNGVRPGTSCFKHIFSLFLRILKLLKSFPELNCIVFKIQWGEL